MSTTEFQAYPEERRIATVLFADLSGFTALADRLDFETVSYLIKEIWLRMDKVVLDHHGYIDKHLGDGIMAIWGAPNASEEDAEQAVSAGLKMHEVLEEFVRSSGNTSIEGLKLRVGINTGMVLATYIGVRNEYTVMGDTVNVASRLEQQADPGSVWISPSTYRSVRGVFQVRRLKSMLLKGKTHPVTPYAVESLLDQPSRIRYRDVGGLVTNMVGREYELEMLQSLYRRTIQGEEPRLVLIFGEMGLGKSRLLMEFANQIETENTRGATLLSARGLAQAEYSPFFFWKSLWKNRFGISDDLEPSIARDKFLRGIQQLWGQRLGMYSSMEAAHLIGDLIGINWPNSPFLNKYINLPNDRSQRAFELTREVLNRLCDNGPTILMLDDLQWSDQGSLDLLAYLLSGSSRKFPLYILASARPDFLRKHPRWQNMAEVVTLAPIPWTIEMVKEAYPIMQPLHDKMLVPLVQRAEGNPYFLEEMVKSLLQGTSESQDIESTWKNLSSNLPNNLQTMLQARLDALPPDVRGVALLGAVVGRVFWEGAIFAAAKATPGTGLLTMSSDVVERIIHNALRQLIRVEFAFPRAGSGFVGEQEYIFKHALLRDVAYSMIPTRYRQQAHLAIAQWLINHAGSDLQAMIAEHFLNGGDHLSAVRYYQNAAEYAFSRGANEEANTLLEKADSLRANR